MGGVHRRQSLGIQLMQDADDLQQCCVVGALQREVLGEYEGVGGTFLDGIDVCWIGKVH